MAGLRLKWIAVDKAVSRAVPLDKRPEGAILLELIRRGDVRHVVALRLDRLFRSPEDALRWMSRWAGTGVVLHVTDLGGQPINTGSAMGRMILAIGDALVNRDLVAGLTARALADRKRMGMVYGPAPYGYRRSGGATKRGERGSDLKVDPKERMVVEQMKALRAEGMTLQQIAWWLKEAEIPCKRGGVKWYPSTVKKILENRIRLPE